MALFKQGRHETGFRALPAGTLWTVRLQTQKHSPADAGASMAREQLTLPPDTAHRLDTLNQLQARYDRAQKELESGRRQLFSDWYKYMLCVYPPEAARRDYPDPDEVRHFIETYVLAPLTRAADNVGTLTVMRDEDDRVTGASAGNSTAESTAASLATAINGLLAQVAIHNRDAREKGGAWTLDSVAAPRYWQPTEPVVLIHGEAAKATSRHGRDGRLHPDGLLQCGLFYGDSDTAELPRHYARIQAAVAQMKARNTLGFFTWSPPWHPFLLEWEVEVFPVHNQGNLHASTRSFDPSFIASSYELAEHEPDLVLKEQEGAVTRAANVYTGSVVLTPYAGSSLMQRLEAKLKNQLVPPYCEAHPEIEPGDPGDDFFDQNKEKIITWYRDTASGAARHSDTYILARTWLYLDHPGSHVLSQALGGFNEALLMHRQVRQLPIYDPLGFAAYQPFCRAVARAVGKDIHSAPQPLNDFNPIRSGVMKINRLRLIDTFGQSVDLGLLHSERHP